MTKQVLDIIQGKRVSKRNYTDDKCISSNNKLLKDVFNPLKSTSIVNSPMNATDEINHAIQAAKKVFKVRRRIFCQPLDKNSNAIQDIFEKNFEELSKILEMDKAGGEYRRTFEFIEIDAPILFSKE